MEVPPSLHCGQESRAECAKSQPSPSKMNKLDCMKTSCSQMGRRISALTTFFVSHYNNNILKLNYSYIFIILKKTLLN